MSEKIYAFLFRLFPARFRAAWHDEALHLFCDRARHERGFIKSLLLWIDLLADIAVTLPRIYSSEDPSLLPAATANSSGVPSFYMLQRQPIQPRSYAMGTILSVVAIAVVIVLLNHGGHVPILHPSAAEDAGGFTVDPWATGPASGDGDAETIAIGRGTAGAAQSATGANPGATVVFKDRPRLPLFDAAEKHRVIEGIIANLNQHYPDAGVARTIAGTLRLHEGLGYYRSIGDPAEFAELVTREIRESSHDLHFEVVYSRDVLREDPAPAVPVEDAIYRQVLRRANCNFEKVDFLPHNVGYLKLDSFPPPDVCGDTAIAAMKTVSRADALIIDLRDNSGGQPEMVMFLAGWLFDEPAFFWNPRENSAANIWTHSPMAGSGLAGKPVYILTSPRTWSAAEHFSYDLKMLHRATLVGETTGGATDVGVFHRIDDHFGIGLRESRVPNPYPVPDWAVHGVSPDVAVPASHALDSAEMLAVQRIARR
ncbi:MAG TPA: S41 family peptidase [Terracidiphilus sp.]|nr:S41 family peptidase [Terracidiphilus sp.]